jgi:subtilisin-like proprotein convertase family protein
MKKNLLYILFFFSFGTAIGQSFTSTVNQALPEGNGTNFYQTISGMPTNQNYYFGLFEIDIYLTHPLTSDVYLSLIAPDGTQVALTNSYGNGANFNHTKFRTYASTSIGAALNISNGIYMPINKFTDFQNNSDPNGSWTLYYQDANTNGLVGNLINWTLTFTNYPNKLAMDSTVTNLPIINFVMPTSIPNSPKLAGSIQLFSNTNNALINSPNFTYNVGVELQGYTSSGGNKPNYDFEIRTATGASLNVPLLNMPAESDWILKSGYTDEFMMKDPLTFEFSRRMGYYAPLTKHVEVFVNGEYQGLYILMEKIKRGADRVDINKIRPSDTTGTNLTGGYIFEINPNGAAADWYSNYLGYNGANQTQGYEFKIVYPKKDSIQLKQKNYLKSYVDSFEDAMNGANYQDANIGWRKYVNEKSFIDFLIVSEYSLNYDTYGRSMYFYKQKATKNNKIYIGPPWDSDRGYISQAVTNGWVHINTHGYWTFPFWWVKVRQDTLFEKRLACRFKTQRNYTLTDLAISNYIAGLDNILKHVKTREYVRWNKYIESSGDLKNIIIDRLNWMDANLQSVTFPPTPIVATNSYLNNPININIGNQYTYNFRPGPDTSYFNPGVTGNYTAVIANQYGCESQKKFSVNIQAPLNATELQFTGKWDGNTNKIRWHTAPNSDIENFELQHSNNGIDFITINEQMYAANDYSFEHNTFQPENFYRLKIFQSNKNFIFSNTISILHNSINNGVLLYPNPATSILYINNKHSDKIEIFNAVGKLMLRQTQNTFEIDISQLPVGSYTAQITTGSEVQSERFIKQ